MKNKLLKNSQNGLATCGLAMAIAMANIIAPSAVAEEVNIGFTAALSGDFASYGENMQRGLELALEHINAENSDVTLKLNPADDRGLPAEGILVAQRFCSDDSVDIIMGYSFSSVALAAIPIIDSCGLPVLASAVTSPNLSNASQYFHRNVLTDATQGALAGRYAAEVLGEKRIAAIYQQDDYGIGVTQAFVEAAEAAGSEVIFNEAYVLGTKDFRTQATSIRTKKPDLLWIGGFYTEAVKIAQQSRRIGLSTPILGSDGLLNSELVELGKDAVEGVTLYAMFDPNVQEPEVKNFVDAFKAKFGVVPDAWAALAYDAGQSVAEAGRIAIAKEGQVDRASLQAALGQLKAYPGVTGPTTFTASGDREGSVVYLQVQDGSFRLAPKQLN